MYYGICYDYLHVLHTNPYIQQLLNTAKLCIVQETFLHNSIMYTIQNTHIALIVPELFLHNGVQNSKCTPHIAFFFGFLSFLDNVICILIHF